jgi:hypothetical protein
VLALLSAPELDPIPEEDRAGYHIALRLRSTGRLETVRPKINPDADGSRNEQDEPERSLRAGLDWRQVGVVMMTHAGLRSEEYN